MLRRSIVFLLFALAPSAALAAPATAPDSAPTLDAARTLAASGDLTGAATMLERIVAATPGDLVAQRYLGDVDVRLGRLGDAERAYSVVTTARPDDRAAHARLGDAYAADDNIDEAIAQYRASLPDAAAYAGLVRLHRRLGDLEAFVGETRASANDRPSDASAQLGYATVLRELHRPAAALAYAERAVDLSPAWCSALLGLGNAQLDLGDLTSAADSFQRCLAIEPNDYSALVDLSVTYPQSRATEARALIARAIARDPNRPEAFVDRGYLSDDAGDVAAAEADYHHALALDVLSRDAYVDLGYDYSAQRRFALAEAALLKGLSVSPDDGRLEYLLGETYARQGKRDLALAQYDKAARSDEPIVAVAAEQRLGAIAR